MTDYTVTLPDGHVLHCTPTKETKAVVALRPGTLFLFEEQVWEALPGSCANLSDLDDASEVIGLEKVVVLKEEVRPCSCRRCMARGETKPAPVTPAPAVMAARNVDRSKFVVRAGVKLGVKTHE